MTGLASVLLGALAGSGTAVSFIIGFGVPILWLIRQRCYRAKASTQYEFFIPAAQIILQAVIISALAALFFWSMPMFPKGFPACLPKARKTHRKFPN